MSEPVLLSTHRDAVAEVTLNRPTRGNALSTELEQALVTGLEVLAADEAVQAVVLTGAGSTFRVELAGSLADKIVADCVNAHQVEAFTANLSAMTKRHKAHAGIRITDVSI